MNVFVTCPAPHEPLASVCDTGAELSPQVSVYPVHALGKVKETPIDRGSPCVGVTEKGPYDALPVTLTPTLALAPLPALCMPLCKVAVYEPAVA